jgi:hypothetical protein
MKKLLIVALTITAALALATAAFAQPDPGDFGIFGDLNASQTSATPPLFTTTNLCYAIAYDVGGAGIFGYEFGVVINPNIIIFASVAEPPGNVNLGPAPTNWIVGTGACLPSAGAVKLVTFTYGVFASGLTDLTFCVTPSTPSSFTPAAPGWLECVTDRLTPFGVAAQGGGIYNDGCFVLYPSSEPPIADAQASWGSVKAQF